MSICIFLLFQEGFADFLRQFIKTDQIFAIRIL